LPFYFEGGDKVRRTLNNSDTVYNSLHEKVRPAAEAWVMGYFKVDQAVSYAIKDEEGGSGRFIASLAIAGFTE
jgi:hypothetical protein